MLDAIHSSRRNRWRAQLRMLCFIVTAIQFGVVASIAVDHDTLSFFEGTEFREAVIALIGVIFALSYGLGHRAFDQACRNGKVAIHDSDRKRRYRLLREASACHFHGNVFSVTQDCNGRRLVALYLALRGAVVLSLRKQ